MTDLEVAASPSRSIDRRTLIKGAAWSVPVIAAAVATPMAAASASNATVAWTQSQTGLLSLTVLGNGSLVTAGVLITVPTQFRVTNGVGALDSPTATVTIVVPKPTTAFSVSTGTLRGFGVYSLNGVVVAGQNSVDYDRTAIGNVQYGFPVTTFVATVPMAAASNGIINMPIVFGLSGTSTSILSVNLLATFAVNMTVDFGNGHTATANTSIALPANAGLL